MKRRNLVLWIFITCVSGSSDPILVAPSLTTSVSWVMVLAEECAAWASFSWVDAAPATSSLVSSTSVLAVFRMLSLRDATHCVTICSLVVMKHQQYKTKQSVSLSSFNILNTSLLRDFFIYSSPVSQWLFRWRSEAPVISKWLFVLRVQSSSWGEHDCGVQVSNNSWHSTGCCDAGLGAFVSRLKCW